MNSLISVAFGYLLGAIPFGLLIARWVAGVDIRELGSGNIGATNVYRTVGKAAGAAVFTLDVAKGAVPPILARYLGLGVPWQVLAGIAAVAGHSASPFLRMHGGKGGATGYGVVIGVMPAVAWSTPVVWGLVVAVTGYVSLATMLGAGSLVPAAVLGYPGDHYRLGFSILVAVFIVFTHRSNIGRLLSGTENRFGHRGKRSEEATHPEKGD